MLAASAGLMLAATGCATKPKRPPGQAPTIEVGPPPKADVWKAVATTADEDRLARLGLAWSEALAEARKSNPGDVRRDELLLRPRAALARPAPTPGSYNCRLVKLGKATAKGRAFESFKPFFCYVEVEGDLLTIVKQTGSQRPAGRLWEDDEETRLIFLGSLALGDEDQPRGLWRRSQARHGRRARADRAVQMAAGDPVAAKHLKARRVRTDPGGAAAPVTIRRICA